MGAGIVMLRETFEASLVVAVILAFLRRIDRRDAFVYVWLGAGAAAILSAAAAAVLFTIGAELGGRAEKIWEGSTMLAAAVVLTWMIFWMRRQARELRRSLERDVGEALAGGSTRALVVVAFVGVVREGLEAALLLFGSVAGANKLVSSVFGSIGLVFAIALGYLFYRGVERLDLRRFFQWTSVLLLLFAAYLLASGLAELQEVGVLPEGSGLLVAAFAALAGPTLYFFLRGPRAKPLVPSA